MPRPFGQARKRFVNAAHTLPCHQCVMRGNRRCRILFRQQSLDEGLLCPFCANMIDGRVAGATCQIGSFVLPGLGCLPKSQEDIVDKIACETGAADVTTDLPPKAIPLRKIKSGNFLVMGSHIF